MEDTQDHEPSELALWAAQYANEFEAGRQQRVNKIVALLDNEDIDIDLLLMDIANIVMTIYVHRRLMTQRPQPPKQGFVSNSKKP